MALSDFYAALAEKARKDEAQQPAGRQRQDREAERAQILADMQEGAAMAREQAKQQDPQAQYEAFCRAQALKIIQAGSRARGLPVPTRLVQDESPEDADITDGDDSPVDDMKDKRSKKKTKKVQGEDEDDAKEKDEDSDDFDSGDTDKPRGTAYPAPGESVAQYWRRVDATAAAIVAAGKRRRGY